MHVSQWTYASAAELAEALGAGKTSASELARDAIERIESADGAINAMCVKTYERALAAAARADERLARGEGGPLTGVPMTIKESFNLAGTPTTWGFPTARDYKPADGALIVERCMDAGAVILGKTNVPIALGDWQSYNDIYGVTNNPYDLARSPGGSSGGSSAALAAGFGPLSLGSDIGGSLRVPAHFCGLFAHKPTHNLVPPRGQAPPFAPAMPGSADLAVVGPMSRTARDLETLFDVIAGPDELEEGVGYKLALPPPRAAALGDARILVLTEHPMSPTDASVGDALEALAATLAKAGARVSRTATKLPDMELNARLYMRLLMSTVMARAPEEMYAEAQAPAAGLDPADRSLRAERLRGATSSYRYWVSNHVGRLGIKAAWRAFFRDYDAVICPAASVPAFPHDPSPDQEARTLIVNRKPVPYLDVLLWPAVATLPGLPATAIPIGRTREGLPVGAQIIGPLFEDRTPLRLAELIEREIGGFVAPPGWS